MGMNLFSSSSSTGNRDTYVSPPAPEPDAKKFVVLKTEKVNKAIVVMVLYPSCTTYEGKKILVYRDANEFLTLKNQKFLDPHFVEGSISPVARFEPTDNGWYYAISLAGIL